MKVAHGMCVQRRTVLTDESLARVGFLEFASPNGWPILWILKTFQLIPTPVHRLVNDGLKLPFFTY